ncbi:MAG TPA: ABC transporter permease [Cyclobacteriaceae bacterium]
MLRNFFAVAMRNFMRQRLYSFINVFGLSSGLLCTLFIYLWVNDEWSKDKFHHEGEKIFQIVANLELNKGELLTWIITPGPLAENIRQNIPEVEMAVRIMDTSPLLFQYGDKSFMESGYFADPDFFKLFSFTITQGKANTDSSDISSISISQKLATKLFGQDNPIGKTVRLNDKLDFTVGAVFKDVGTASSLRFEYILPFEIYKKQRGEEFNWGNFDHPLYVKLNDPSNAESTLAKINASADKAFKNEGVSYYMQPFSEYYLHSQYENGKPVGGRIKYVQIFSIVAIFILIIACINFMNMATAKAATRSKEVGIRKVVGAQRLSLIFQFIAESTVISLISALLALIFVTLLLPYFNLLVNKQIEVNFIDLNFLVSLLIIVVVTGVLAGSYPAFFLSSYQPVTVLKNSSSQRMSGSTLRKGLVVFQFALTVILIASSLIIYSQINFIRTKNIGYNRQAVLSFNMRGQMAKNFDVLKNELLEYPGIKFVSRADNSLVQVNNQNGSVDWPGKPENSSVFFRTVVVDYDFLETMDLQLVEGRFFSKDHNDTSTFVISERAAKVMGLKEPIGTRIVQWGMPGTIIGVVKDFHSQSLHQAIDPIVFMYNTWPNRVFVKFDPTQLQSVVKKIETIYKKYNSEFPFTYSFLDDDFEKLYNNEKVTGSLALGFTAMAIIISGLGLLGLAAFTAEKKKKEISIRKVLGASVAGIVSMMSVDFIKLSVVASIIGCPIAYLLMQQLLEGYAYHTELKWSLFIITAGCALCLSMLTVVFQVAKAAIANPVDALRNE